MKTFVLLASCAALAACGETATQEAAPAENIVVDDVTPAAMSLNETTWTWESDGTEMVISIDADGNYIMETADGEHLDHGTYVQTEEGDCFTSEMNEEGAECWTTSETIEIGSSVESSSDKGNSGDYTRVEYRELSMPGA